MNRVLPGRLLVVFVGVLAAMGLWAWWTMPRQEDPSLPARWGQATIPFEGADPAAVERLVVDVVERHLAEVEPLERLYTRATLGGAVFAFELAPDLEDPRGAWDDVDEALQRAAREFPEGVGAVNLDRDTNDQDALVVAVHGSPDPLTLRRAALDLRQWLLGSPDVSQVRLIGDPGEQVTIGWDPAVAEQVQMDASMLAEQLQRRHVTPVAGVAALGPKRATIQHTAEFVTTEQLRRTPIALPDGTTAALGALATVEETPAYPPRQRAWWGERPAVFVGVVLGKGVDVVASGDRVRAHLERYPGLEHLQADVMLYQPAQVQSRLEDLGASLAQSIAIVTLLMVVTMGLRLGFVVGSVIPLIALVSLALYAQFGGILHQVSIAAFVISLGIIVDNAIVVAESMQAAIDEGAAPPTAASRVTRELLVPLGAATGTTLGGFLPIALSSGTTADFIRDLPIVLLITLTLSYVFAILVAPPLAARILRRSAARPSRGPSVFARFARWLGAVAWNWAWTIVGGAAVAVGLAAWGTGLVDEQFFPESDRPIAVVDLTLPEGTALEEVAALAHRLDRTLAQRHPDLDTATFVGRGAPHFYYNLPEWPNSPHRAQIVVVTPRTEQLPPLIDEIRSIATEPWLADAQVVVGPLRQGPPVSAPIEVRLTQGSLDDLVTASQRVRDALAEIPGAIEVRTDASLGTPVLEMDIDPIAAARSGVAPDHVSQVLRAHTLGLTVGELRSGPDPVPVVVGGAEHREPSPETLMGLPLVSGRQVLPLASVATLGILWRPAIIRHRDRARVVTVMASVGPGQNAEAVRSQLSARLESLELPPGVVSTFGGESEESSSANASLGRAAPLGVMVLIGCLVVSFNSMRRTAIVLITIPLALPGIVPGLLLGGQPFGFMALLGVIALVGIVVNNAIVLIDRADRLRRAGMPPHEAIPRAVASRTRPILLTSLTTVAGLVPLATSSSRLWPPLAWPMMTGLIASTILTLLVVPALYRIVCRRMPDTPQTAELNP